MRIVDKKSASRTKLMIKKCTICKKRFGTYRPTRKTCTMKCKIISSNLKRVGHLRSAVCIGDVCKIKLNTDEYAIFSKCDLNRVNKKYWSLRKHRNTKYVQSSYKGSLISMHQFILGNVKGLSIDHIDGNGLNNHRSNLRRCSHKDNIRSSRSNTGVSKFKGVAKNGLIKWRAYISPNRKQIHLGNFETEIEAAEAYNKAAIKYFGEYALLNDLSSPGQFVQQQKHLSTSHK